MRRRQDDDLTIGQTADYLRLAVDTVRRLERNGELRATRTAGRHRRFRRDVVEAFRVRQETRARRASAPSGAPAPRRPAPSIPRPTRPTYPVRPVVDPDGWDDPEEWHDDEPPLRRAAPAPRQPQPSIQPVPRAQVPDMQDSKRVAEELQRLNRIKASGVNGIPYDVPPQWRGKVVEDLNRYVTAERFPDWVSDWEAQKIVRGRVEDVLKPYRDQVAEDAARKTQREDTERKMRALIAHGTTYAQTETISDWDYSEGLKARREVEERLTLEVKANWTELRVRDLVDEILSDE